MARRTAAKRRASAMSAELPRTLKVVTVWLVVGAAAFVGIEWWQHRQLQTRVVVDGSTVELRRGADGHYHWPGSVNGRPVDFLVDTGATGTAIPAALAASLGLASLGRVRSNTAGGAVSGDVVRVDVELKGGVSAQRLRVVALAGLGEQPLLGMDVLGRLRWRQQDGALHVELGDTPR